MKNVFLYPYNSASESSKTLAEALGIKRIKTENSSFVPTKDKIIINWGRSSMPDQFAESGVTIINKPEAVEIASDKLKFFSAVCKYNRNLAREDRNEKKVVRIPTFYVNREDALEAIYARQELVARTVLKGSSGEGIVLISHAEEMIDAPLYTTYIKKKSEYRVHVMGDRITRVQRKARRKEVPDDQINWKIRNHNNGFVFAAQDDLGEVPYDVSHQALCAIKAVGLDFGAVDIVWSEHYGVAYVLEINTAPGMEGETVPTYVNSLSELIERYNQLQQEMANGRVGTINIPAPEPWEDQAIFPQAQVIPPIRPRGRVR